MDRGKRKTRRTNTAVISIETDDQEAVEYVISEEIDDNDYGIEDGEGEQDDVGSSKADDDDSEEVEVEVEHVCGKCNSTFHDINVRTHVYFFLIANHKFILLFSVHRR